MKEMTIDVILEENFIMWTEQILRKWWSLEEMVDVETWLVNTCKWIISLFLENALLQIISE